MKDLRKNTATTVFPQRIRTYITFNLVIAVLLAVIIAVRAELRTGRHLLIDLCLIAFYSSVLVSLFAGPLAIVQIYLYRRNKGAWHDWKKLKRRPRRDRGAEAEARRYWKSEAVRARLLHGGSTQKDIRDRTRLFETSTAADAVSRASLLLTVADRFERTGKREAAERCYAQITQRFAGSPEAREVARRRSALARP